MKNRNIIVGMALLLVFNWWLDRLVKRMEKDEKTYSAAVAQGDRTKDWVKVYKRMGQH